jgi:hypothetical protein
MIHYSTFVLPTAASRLPYDVPFVVFGADTAEENEHIPMVTSLHRIRNEAMPYCHAAPVLGAIPVSDGWAQAVEGYDRAAKVVILREPVPRDIATTYAPAWEGVLGPDLPPWLGAMLDQRLHAAVRDVPVSAGEDPLSIGIDPAAPTTYPEWAQRIINPGPVG